mgnify:CR=1 FL=1
MLILHNVYDNERTDFRFPSETHHLRLKTKLIKHKADITVYTFLIHNHIGHKSCVHLLFGEIQR